MDVKGQTHTGTCCALSWPVWTLKSWWNKLHPSVFVRLHVCIIILTNMYLVPIENNYNDCLAAFSLKCSQKEISQSPVREQKLLMISHDGLGHPKTLGTLMDLLVDRDMDSFLYAHLWRMSHPRRLCYRVRAQWSNICTRASLSRVLVVGNDNSCCSRGHWRLLSFLHWYNVFCGWQSTF